MSEIPLLTVESLSIAFLNHTLEWVVQDVSFSIHNRQSLALVGASGSGKSLTALAINQCLPDNAVVASHSQIKLRKTPLLGQSESTLQTLRGRTISMIFQDALSALNPIHRVGYQLDEALKQHHVLSSTERKHRIHEMLEAVELHPQLYTAYPHELSGGMQQRVMIAMALITQPDLLIADEPTTALDVTLQAQLIQLLKRLTQTYHMGLLFITHNLQLATQLADDALIMHEGRIVESGPLTECFHTPKHPYTKALLKATDLNLTTSTPPSNTAPLINIQNACLSFQSGPFWRRHHTHALSSVHLTIQAFETLALIGESGSGKTTLARALCGLNRFSTGTFRKHGAAHDWRPHDIQMIFQNPTASMNPRFSIKMILNEGLQCQRPKLSASERHARIHDALKSVQLPLSCLDRFPHELSGGQRQRVCLARALCLKPKLLVLDEPTSALDVLVQSEIIACLKHLKTQHQLTYVLITHDFHVVSALADRIGVMKQGRLVEIGTTQSLLNAPQHPYTQTLIRAAMLDPSS